MSGRALPLVAALLLSAGCSLTRPPDASLPPARLPPAGIDVPAASPAPGARLLGIAERFVGAPYRFGGSSAERGFDCSGLVLRVHELAGLAVPRTALGQHAAARPVPQAELQPGDLVFFASGRGPVDHVGIYAGAGRFLHAPRRGRPVGYDRLDDAWFAPRFVGAGRFWTPQAAAAAEAPAP
jgi:cell wall-associated NlpC family hydrolase